MKYLLDTHAFLWWLMAPDRLSKKAYRCIEKSNHQVYVSTASLWEIAIKVRLGRLSIQAPIGTFLIDQIHDSQFLILPVAAEHALRVAELPLHHGDPFDHLLIAQSLEEKIPLISKDADFDDYEINVVW